MKTNKIFLIGLLFFFLGGFCIAGNRPNAVTLNLSEAYYHFSSTRDLKNASMPNIALDYNFNEQWAIEGGVGLINTNQRSDDQGARGILYTIDGLYRFKPYQRFEPYVLAGIGVLGLKPSSSDNHHQGNINAGVGTQFFADESIALRAELRDLYTLSGGKNDWIANFGISYLFDSKKSAPAGMDAISLKDENPKV